MAPTPEEALKLAALLSQKIMDRRAGVQQAVAYFRGEEGRLRFASDEFRDYFQRRFVGLSDNWCMPVAQTPIERIHWRGVRLAGDTTRTADPDSQRDWEANEADRGLSEAVLMMTIAKRSYGLVSQIGDASGKRGRLTFENPDSAAVIYDGATRQRKAGMLVWADDTAEYGELLLPGSVLSVRRDKVALNAGDRYVPPDASGWIFDAKRNGGVVERPHPFGVVPLVEMRNQALLDNDPISDIGLVMPMQDAINLVWAYTLNALDYISLPGRVVLNGEVPKEDILDETGKKIGERPMELDSLVRDRVAWLQGQGLSIGEWSKASIDGFKDVIELAVGHVAAQTRTPAHYLLSSSSNVPAAGYDLAEAGLVSKAAERIGFATGPVKEMSRLLALAAGDTQRADRIASGRVLWAKPQYRSEAQLMDGLGKLRAAGFPFQWIAEEYGLTPDEVERVMQMVRDEGTDPYLSQVAAKDAAAQAAPMSGAMNGAVAAAPAVG